MVFYSPRLRSNYIAIVLIMMSLVGWLVFACKHTAHQEDSQAEKMDHPGTFQTIEKKYPNSQLDGYNLYFPPAYDKRNQDKFPLVVFLQGGLGVGGKVVDIFKWELPKELKESRDLSTEIGQLKLNTFIYVMPHIAQGEYYHSEEAIGQLLDELTREYRVDTNRFYLTGLSRGGHGSWGLASEISHRFAAVAPIAGAAHGIRDYEGLTEIPIWTAHNEMDDRVDHYRTENIVRRIEQLSGVSFHRTETVAEADYLKHEHIFTSGKNPNHEHDAWTAMYNNVNFYRWLLRFSRK